MYQNNQSMFRIKSLLFLFKANLIIRFSTYYDTIKSTHLTYLHAWNQNSLIHQCSRKAMYFWIKHNEIVAIWY